MDPIIESLERAVAAAPEDHALRLHLAELLVERGRGEDAMPHLATMLSAQPGNARARELMTRVLSPAVQEPGGADTEPDDDREDEFDWHAAESELGPTGPQPMFVADAEPREGPAYDVDVERSHVRLADVGGMESVKRRLDAAFLAPMRHPELRQAYGKSLRGGMLLYGPPGCGKTFIGRALAGELGAAFLTLGLSEILDMWLGQSEANLHELFETARRHAPCVLFLDEIDALGQRRSQTSASTRNIVNQLLQELDGVDASNEGVFVIAATNTPWDVDPALRRPGRLDRTMFVAPPDRAAREAIFRSVLAQRPIEGIDPAALADATEGYSGADLVHVCDTAVEAALMDSAISGEVRLVTMRDLRSALTQVRPSIGPWLESARTVVEFANTDGSYDELGDFLRQSRRRRSKG